MYSVMEIVQGILFEGIVIFELFLFYSILVDAESSGELGYMYIT